MENFKEVEEAITLTFKKKETKFIKCLEKVESLIKELRDWTTIIYSLEEHKTGGYHVHIYYKGKQIYWKNFNSLWSYGYVKNKKMWDKEGWLSYIRKEGTYYVRGKALEVESIIEKFTGKTLKEAVIEFRVKNELNQDDMNYQSEDFEYDDLF